MRGNEVGLAKYINAFDEEDLGDRSGYDIIPKFFWYALIQRSRFGTFN